MDLYKDADALVLFFSDKPSYLSLEAKWLIETREISAGKAAVPIFVAQLGSIVPERQATTWAESRKYKYVKCDGNFCSTISDSLINRK